ncbi:MAG: hypothetical protein GY696_28390 [Gammaproteobacteria bacterium]|nr:hypothetical protein [Gammaproteobacteria bacterium]
MMNHFRIRKILQHSAWVTPNRTQSIAGDKGKLFESCAIPGSGDMDPQSAYLGSFFPAQKLGNFFSDSSNMTNVSKVEPLCGCSDIQDTGSLSLIVLVIYFLLIMVYMSLEMGSIFLYFRVWHLNKTELEDFSINKYC